MAAQTEFRIDMKRDRFEAPMFNSKVWQIGPGGVSQVPDVTSPLPYAAHAYLRPGQRAASAAHAGWSLLYVIDGSFKAGNAEYKKGDVCIGEPWSESGPVVAGPQGVTELAIYENGAACMPYFCDKSDPAYVELRKWLDAQGLEFPEPTPPPGGFTGKKYRHNLLDGRETTPWFHSKLFEVGPLQHVVGLPLPESAVASNRPFFCHAWSDPGLDVPDHMHDGWSFITCLEGRYDYVEGQLLPGDFLLRSPEYVSRNQTRPGPEGMTEIVVFANGRSVTPIIVDENDPKVPAFRTHLHL
jgi:anti-sigma factor ChrR (cupin superfamily)